MALSIISILDLMDQIGENETQNLLSDFSCPINPEIEYFLQHNAIDFAKKKLSDIL